ncbi:MAG: hypothetical protein ACI85K_000592 [Hyphomicrobiaceae bacterium]|jgi:hypothetical protein
MTNAQLQPDFADTFAASRTARGVEGRGDSFVVAELKRAARVSHSSREQVVDQRFGNEQAQVMMVADASRVSLRNRASQLVIDEVMNDILNAVPWTPKLDVAAEANLCHRLQQAFVHGSDALRAAGCEASLTMAFVRWPTLFVVHAGCNRAYQVREGKALQLTRDDSNHSSAVHSPLGGPNARVAQLTTQTLQAGDSVLVCSSSLAQQLDTETVGRVVGLTDSAQSAGSSLLAAGLKPDDARTATIAITRFLEFANTRVKKRVDPVRDVAAEAHPIPVEPSFVQASKLRARPA